MIFFYTEKKISLDKRGVKKQNFFYQGGVNRVSCRRGDSDFALQEGGNGTLPPPCPRVIVLARTYPGRYHDYYLYVHSVQYTHQGRARYMEASAGFTSSSVSPQARHRRRKSLNPG